MLTHLALLFRLLLRTVAQRTWTQVLFPFLLFVTWQFHLPCFHSHQWILSCYDWLSFLFFLVHTSTSRFSVTCTLFSFKIVSSSTNIIVHRDSCFTSSVSLSIPLASKQEGTQSWSFILSHLCLEAIQNSYTSSPKVILLSNISHTSLTYFSATPAFFVQFLPGTHSWAYLEIHKETMNSFWPSILL